jgi:magnesium transporter
VTDAPETAAEDRDELEGLYGATDAVVRGVKKGIAETQPDVVTALIEPLHAADMADLFEHLTPDERDILVTLVGADLDPEFFTHLDESVREDVIEDLDTEQLAEVVNELETDDAVGLIEGLDESEQEQLLNAVAPAERALYEEALRYPEDSAGRLMDREAATVPSYWNIGQTIDYMRSDADLPSNFYDIYIVGPTYRPVGLVPVSRLLRTERPVGIGDIMDTELKLIPATMDQEDVAFLFRQYGLVSAPVVDDHGRLVGVITVDDVVDVIEEEHQEDMLKLGGVSEDDFYDAVIDTTRSRFSWLLINLGTAILASMVIALFDAAIDKVVALAVLMPIVASMGGNAGTQTLTVAVRALAVKELTPTNAMRIVGKETLVGGINGVLFAALMGFVAWFWFESVQIGGVIAAAMVINLFVAGLAGTMIPLTLDRFGIDPAVASSVVLTTLTDVVGFLSFLGLAALVLL